MEGSQRLRSPTKDSSAFDTVEDAIRWMAVQAREAGAFSVKPADLETKILWDNHAPSALI
jgi:hypothetical protein